MNPDSAVRIPQSCLAGLKLLPLTPPLNSVHPHSPSIFARCSLLHPRAARACFPLLAQPSPATAIAQRAAGSAQSALSRPSPSDPASLFFPFSLRQRISFRASGTHPRAVSQRARARACATWAVAPPLSFLLRFASPRWLAISSALTWICSSDPHRSASYRCLLSSIDKTSRFVRLFSFRTRLQAPGADTFTRKNKAAAAELAAGCAHVHMRSRLDRELGTESKKMKRMTEQFGWRSFV